MKIENIIAYLSVGLLLFTAQSCKNADIDFPDFDYSAVYFAYQYPVRTLVLGEDIYDTTIDNEHKCEIYATISGVYNNDNVVDIDVEIDNSLCDNLLFEAGGDAVKAMPSSYYSLLSDKITLNKTMQGAVQVQFTDDYFADPLSLETSYVIPLRMKQVYGADSILMGTPAVDSPKSCNSADWDILPKDYVLYAVKYINKYHATYLRRGQDKVTDNGITTTYSRHESSVEKDALCNLTSLSLTEVQYPINSTFESQDDNIADATLSCEAILSFSDDESCTVRSASEDYTISGTGSFVKDGEIKSWGNQDRDAIYLKYTIEKDGVKYETADTLVVRDRGVKMEVFTPVYSE